MAKENVEIKKQNDASVILWFTGMSGSGKSSISQGVRDRLTEKKQRSFILDGDKVRRGLNSDLGFSNEDRSENIRRIGEMANLCLDLGMVIIVAVISPLKKDRQIIRQKTPPGKFIEIFIDCSLEKCEQRDPKGLYKKARRGEIKDFTGIDSPYEAPESPEIHLKTDQSTLDECIDTVVQYLSKHNYISFDH